MSQQVYFVRAHSRGGFAVDVYDDWEALLEDCAEDGYAWVLECFPSGATEFGPDFDEIVEDKRLELRGKFRDHSGQIRRVV